MIAGLNLVNLMDWSNVPWSAVAVLGIGFCGIVGAISSIPNGTDSRVKKLEERIVYLEKGRR